ELVFREDHAQVQDRLDQVGDVLQGDRRQARYQAGDNAHQVHKGTVGDIPISPFEEGVQKLVLLFIGHAVRNLRILKISKNPRHSPSGPSEVQFDVQFLQLGRVYVRRGIDHYVATTVVLGEGNKVPDGLLTTQ